MSTQENDILFNRFLQDKGLIDPVALSKKPIITPGIQAGAVYIPSMAIPQAEDVNIGQEMDTQFLDFVRQKKGGRLPGDQWVEKPPVTAETPGVNEFMAKEFAPTAPRMKLEKTGEVVDSQGKTMPTFHFTRPPKVSPGTWRQALDILGVLAAEQRGLLPPDVTGKVVQTMVKSVTLGILDVWRVAEQASGQVGLAQELEDRYVTATKVVGYDPKFGRIRFEEVAKSMAMLVPYARVARAANLYGKSFIKAAPIAQRFISAMFAGTVTGTAQVASEKLAGEPFDLVKDLPKIPTHILFWTAIEGLGMTWESVKNIVNWNLKYGGKPFGTGKQGGYGAAQGIEFETHYAPGRGPTTKANFTAEEIRDIYRRADPNYTGAGKVSADPGNWERQVYEGITGANGWREAVRRGWIPPRPVNIPGETPIVTGRTVRPTGTVPPEGTFTTKGHWEGSPLGEQRWVPPETAYQQVPLKPEFGDVFRATPRQYAAPGIVGTPPVTAAAPPTAAPPPIAGAGPTPGGQAGPEPTPAASQAPPPGTAPPAVAGAPRPEPPPIVTPPPAAAAAPKPKPKIKVTPQEDGSFTVENVEPEAPKPPLAEPAPKATKEPWGMTRKEMGDLFLDDEPKFETRAAVRNKKAVGEEGIAAANDHGALETLGYSKASLEDYGFFVYTKRPSPLNIGEVDAPGAGDGFFISMADLGRAGKGGIHKAIVSAAMREGKPIPPEILAEYPDLEKAPEAKPELRTDQPLRDAVDRIAKGEGTPEDARIIGSTANRNERLKKVVEGYKARTRIDVLTGVGSNIALRKVPSWESVPQVRFDLAGVSEANNDPARGHEWTDDNIFKPAGKVFRDLGDDAVYRKGGTADEFVILGKEGQSVEGLTAKAQLMKDELERQGIGSYFGVGRNGPDAERFMAENKAAAKAARVRPPAKAARVRPPAKPSVPGHLFGAKPIPGRQGEPTFEEAMAAGKDRAAEAAHAGIPAPKKPGRPLTRAEELEARAKYYQAENERMEQSKAKAREGDPEALKEVADDLLRGTGQPAESIDEFKKNAFMDGEEAKKVAQKYVKGETTYEDATALLKGMVQDTVAEPSGVAEKPTPYKKAEPEGGAPTEAVPFEVTEKPVAYKRLVEKMPKAECFRNAYRWASDHKEETPVLVHGKVLGVSGDMIDHAWVEVGNEVVDPTIGGALPKETYYKTLRAVKDNSYTVDQALLNLAHTHNFGPWEPGEITGPIVKGKGKFNLTPPEEGKVAEKPAGYNLTGRHLVRNHDIKNLPEAVEYALDDRSHGDETFAIAARELAMKQFGTIDVDKIPAGDKADAARFLQDVHDRTMAIDSEQVGDVVSVGEFDEKEAPGFIQKAMRDAQLKAKKLHRADIATEVYRLTSGDFFPKEWQGNTDVEVQDNRQNLFRFVWENYTPDKGPLENYINFNKKYFIRGETSRGGMAKIKKEQQFPKTVSGAVKDFGEDKSAFGPESQPKPPKPEVPGDSMKPDVFGAEEIRVMNALRSAAQVYTKSLGEAPGFEDKAVDILKSRLLTSTPESLRSIGERLGYSKSYVKKQYDAMLEILKDSPAIKEIMARRMVQLNMGPVPSEQTLKHWAKMLRKYFSSYRGADKIIDQQNDARIGGRMAEIFDQTIDAAKINKWLKDQPEGTNEYLAQLMRGTMSGDGMEDIQNSALPDDIKGAMLNTRQRVDRLSDLIIAHGGLAEETRAAFENNIGRYLAKSYRLYQDKHWSPTDAQKDGFKRWLMNEYTMTPEQADEFIDAELAYGRNDEGIRPQRSRRTRRVPTENFIRRKVLSPAWREFAGEIERLPWLVTHTITKQATMGYNARFLDWISEYLPDHWTADYQEAAQRGWQNSQFPEHNYAYGKLAGKWVDPELHQYITKEFDTTRSDMEEAVQKFIMNPFKWTKTIGSLPAHSRNFLSNFGFSMLLRNSIFNPLNAKWYTKSLNVHANKTGSARDVWKTLLEEGVTGTQFYGAEIPRMHKDIMRFDPATWPEKIWDKFVAWPIDKFGELYNFGDSLYRVSSYLKNTAPTSEGGFGMTPTKAVEELNAGLQNYRKLPVIVDWLRRWPLLGPFISFKANTVKIIGKQAEMAVEEIKSPATRSRGIGRWLRLALFLSVPAIISEISKKVYDVDDKQIKELERWYPEYRRNGTFIYFRGEDDKLKIFDMSFLWPTGDVERFGKSILKGDISGAKDALDFFSHPLLDAWSILIKGQDPQWGTKYRTIVDRAKAAAAYLYLPASMPIPNLEGLLHGDVRPGNLTGPQIKAVIDAFNGQPDQYGRTKQLPEEVKNFFTGIRTWDVDPEKLLAQAAIQRNGQIRELQGEYARWLRKNTLAPQWEKDAKKKTFVEGVEKISAELRDIGALGRELRAGGFKAKTK